MKTAKKPLTASDDTAIIIPEASGKPAGSDVLGCAPVVCIFSYIYITGARMLIRGCHAPVLVRQGTAEARHRAPTYRERWVKNDGSGTLGFFGDQRSPRHSGCVFVWMTDFVGIKKALPKGRAGKHFINSLPRRRTWRCSSRRWSASCGRQ